MRDPASPQADLARVVVDTAPIRCPDVDPRVERALAEPFPAPPPSRPLADGRSGLDDDAKRAWIDRAEQLDARKTAAGQRAVADLKACRGAPEPKAGS